MSDSLPVPVESPSPAPGSATPLAPLARDGAPRDLEWDEYVAAEQDELSEPGTPRRILTIPQALELARLHVIEGRTPNEIAARWPDWTPEQIRRAIRTQRFLRAAEHLQRESLTLAGRLLARLNVAADDTIDRIIRIAQGKEIVGEAVDKDGNAIPVPFSDKVQWEAMRWHADRVLPPVANGSNAPGGTTVIYNQTTYNATMQHLSAGLHKLSAVFGGDPRGLPNGAGPGGVSSPDGTVAAGSPPSMSSYLKRGAAELVQNDDAIPAMLVDPA